MADESKEGGSKGPLTGMSVAILIEFNVEDMELMYPLFRLKEEGADVFTLGSRADLVYKGKHGYPRKADKLIDDVKAADVDCVIVPGGWAPDYWRRDSRYTNLIAECNEAGKLIGAICHGPWLLVSAKILRERKLTCFCSIKDDVENAGAKFVDEECVVDGNLITSRIPDDLPAFMKAIIAHLKATKADRDAALV